MALMLLHGAFLKIKNMLYTTRRLTCTHLSQDPCTHSSDFSDFFHCSSCCCVRLMRAELMVEDMPKVFTLRRFLKAAIWGLRKELAVFHSALLIVISEFFPASA